MNKKVIQAQRGFDELQGTQRDERNRPIIEGTGLITRASRALNPNADLYSYRDLEEAERKAAFDKLTEAKMEQNRLAEEKRKAEPVLEDMMQPARNRAPASVQELPMDAMQKLDMYLQNNPQRAADLEKNPQLKQAFELYKRGQQK